MGLKLIPINKGAPVQRVISRLGNGLKSGRHQAITSANGGWLSMKSLEKIHYFNEMLENMLSVKSRPFH